MAINLLPPQLANQIAAGEVVERPASVVKELLENSLDAGATTIDIDIDKGGAKLIRIRDNGCGISRDDLKLALARHATSKISTLDDLEAIMSMGFRGEALASISSVSRLTLTSRTASQEEAWQAYAEGRDMTVAVKPAAHPVGSTVEVLDLFYNTPARRKFLRTEKTEFGHIDEVVRRIALSRFDVSINLTHNGKRVRQYRAAKETHQHHRRLSAICGNHFVDQAMQLTWEHGDLAIKGWVEHPLAPVQSSEIQYCYVNGRMMRDRLINHAIRQAYEGYLQGEQQPSYVLYLTVDPHQVDVNVHPAKHEVRFHESRLVHDFIYQAVLSVLRQVTEDTLSLDEEDNGALTATTFPENRQVAGENVFSQPYQAPVTSSTQKKSTGAYQGSAGKGLTDTQKSPQKTLDTRQFGESYQRTQGMLYQKMMQESASDVENKEKIPLFPPRPPLNLVDVGHTTNNNETNVISVVPRSVNASAAQTDYTFGRVLAIYQQKYALIESSQGLGLLALEEADFLLKCAQLLPENENLKPQPLLVPLKITLSKDEINTFKQFQALISDFGIVIDISHGKATIHAVSLPLRQQNLPVLLTKLLAYLATEKLCSKQQIGHWLAKQLSHESGVWSQAQAVGLLADIERLCPQYVRQPSKNLLQLIELQPVVAALNNERSKNANKT
ncbi:TPA: DNA mismatch repair endonuclease MutL [Proteus mirabilis]|nr:DNA mismatch repair endonuclease MutL [Proteus mirabilis]HEJ9492111.1 DNA mismatch repair endonuclease MutL [Proteus mirabilis]HEJ9691818.1 DNA mismatch repair endonuclease MutL [Proteus mirabilis]